MTSELCICKYRDIILKCSESRKETKVSDWEKCSHRRDSICSSKCYSAKSLVMITRVRLCRLFTRIVNLFNMTFVVEEQIREEVSFRSITLCEENVALRNTQEFGPTNREAHKGSKNSHSGSNDGTDTCYITTNLPFSLQIFKLVLKINLVKVIFGQNKVNSWLLLL